MTWDDTDSTELDKYVDEIEENAYQVGIIVGKSQERNRIIRQLENIATNVIKSGNEYWDGYVRALEDVRLDNWPLEDSNELR
jgi:RNase P protein component